jgi:single-strand DNA-binding protein
MSININTVLLGGNLTRDPVVRFLANETAVANFTLAINRKFKSGNEMKEEVTFIDCECWGRTAELAGQYLTKGRGAFIEGKLKLDTWKDKEGKNCSKLKVVADSVQFLDSGKRGQETERFPSEYAAPKPTRPASATVDDNLDQPPF